MLKIALIVNPIAGIGGSVALKGSDGAETLARAVARRGKPRGPERAQQFLAALDARLDPAARNALTWLAPAGSMGAEPLRAAGFAVATLSHPGAETSNADTIRAVQGAQEARADLIVFVGGDGTARDVLRASDATTPVLGVPAGVKMHSGVFAVTPAAAAEVVAGLLAGELVAVAAREVRDWDPAAAELKTRFYGELNVPEAHRFIQHTKVAGRESEPLALEEIVAEVAERLAGADVLIGPGSTCLAIKHRLGAEQATLLGFDALRGGAWRLDLDARGIAALVTPATRVVLSFTRVQGFLLGRGNQQLTSDILRSLDWPDQFTFVGTRSKLLSLEGRPLLVDTGDPALDARLAGLVPITVGYEDRVLYRVASQMPP